MRIGFVGASYTSKSTAVADEECINWYAETLESQAAIAPSKPYGGQTAASVKSYYGTPGLSIFSADANGGPLRGQWWTGSQLFAVDGDTLYEVFADGTRNEIGNVTSDGNPVSMVNNTNQLLVISNGYCYCYTLSPGVWTANKVYTVGQVIKDAAGHIQKATAAAWIANMPYAIGAQIVDPNGNIQQAEQAKWIANTLYNVGAEIVDAANHIQKASAAAWVANTTYLLGAEIVDSNGNAQKAYSYAWAANTAYALGFQIVDSNGNVQQVTTAGTSGASAPVWNGAGVTADGTGTLVWTYQAASGGNAGTSGATVPAWSSYGATTDGTTLTTLFWVYQASANGKAGTSGADIPTFDDAGGSVLDSNTLTWTDQGLATNAGVSGTTEPIFQETGNTTDANTLVWAEQGPAGDNAGTSGAAIPDFNDAGGNTPDGTGTLLWVDKGLQLLNVSSQMAGTPLKADYSDSYFIVMFLNSNKFQMSQVLDGTTWPGLLVNEVEVFAENISSLIVNHREPWIMGFLRSQPYQDTGSNEVFDVIPGTLIEKGCVATFAPARLDNSIFWIDQDERGALSAWRSNGYVPMRVSTHAVELDLGTNTPANLAAMVSYSYEDVGHLFWVIYVPQSLWSWCYDVTEGLWHKRSTWNTQLGVWGPHQSWNHTYAFGKHLVGDWATGNLYQMSAANYTDNGKTIRRLRRAPTVIAEMARIYHAELSVDFDTGNGPQPPLVDGNGNPRPPQAVLRFSDNRGKTWSNQHVQGTGFAGQYNARAIWRRLGQSRYRVYELVVTDPVFWCVVDAYLRISSGGGQV